MKSRILFILNPIAGISKKENIPALIDQLVDKNMFETEVRYTERAGHASEIAAAAVSENFDYVAAVGGDGTINEIGNVLVNTSATLIIIPAGSGNGLAVKLGVPFLIRQALALINKGRIIEIDAPKANGRYFFSNSGMGYEGLIAHQFAQTKKRGFFEYARLGLKYYMNYKEKTYQLTIDGKKRQEKLWAIEVSNSGSLGYGIKSVAHSDLQDGLLDVLMVKKFPKWKMLVMFPVFALGFGSWSRHVSLDEVKEIEVTCTDVDYIQLDGDPLEKGTILEASLVNDKLKVLVP